MGTVIGTVIGTYGATSENILKANSSSSAAATAVTMKKVSKRPRAGAAEKLRAMWMSARMSATVINAVDIIEEQTLWSMHNRMSPEFRTIYE
jgi:hypothetical protein